MWKPKPALFSWATVAPDEEASRGSKRFPLKKTTMISLLLWPLCYFSSNLFVYIEHGELLVRHGVHRERNSEARHVRQPVHVPRRLHFWLHERSSRWSFLQSVGPQLWLVPPSHVYNPKQTSSVFDAFKKKKKKSKLQGSAMSELNNVFHVP